MIKKIFSIFAAALLALVLVACKKEVSNDQQALLNEAHNNLSIIVPGGDLTKVENDFTVNISLRNDVKVSWASNNEAVAYYGGVSTTSSVLGVIKVVRPVFEDGDVTVKLTATLTLGELTKTKEFTITILKKDQVSDVKYTLKEIREGAVALDEVVEVEEVTVVNIGYNGITLFDGEAVMFAFYGTGFVPVTIEVGQIGTIQGKFEVGEETQYQFTSPTFTQTGVETEPLKGIETEISHLWLDATTKAEVLEEMKDSTKVNFFELTGIVAFREDLASGDNYRLVLFDKNEDPATSTKNFVRIYYRTPAFDQIRLLEGKEIKIQGVINAIRNDRMGGTTQFVYELNVTSFESVEELTDAEKVDLDKSALTVQEQFITAGNIVLPIKGANGSVITWAFKDETNQDNALINLETGAVAVPADGQTEVKIVATIKSGEALETKEFTISLGEVVEITIAEALAKPVNAEVKVRGVVIGFQTSVEYKNSTVYIQDETGVILLYRVTGVDLVLGQEYVVEGVISAYQGFNQIKDLTMVKTEASVVELTPETITGALVEANIFHLVTIEGEVRVSASGRTIEIFNGDIKYTLYSSSTGDLGQDVYDAIQAKLIAGTSVSITGIVGHYNKAPQMLLFSADQITVLESNPTDPVDPTPTDPVDPTPTDPVDPVQNSELVVNLDFTTLAESTSYTSSLTDTTVVNSVDGSSFVISRLFSNISTESKSGIKGLVLGIRKTTFGSPILQTKTAINGLSKIEFTMYNWSTDAQYNKADFLNKFVVEISTDGTNWTLAKDITSELTTDASGKMDISVELATAGNYFVRIMAVANTGISSTYQLRYIFTSLKLYGILA